MQRSFRNDEHILIIYSDETQFGYTQILACSFKSTRGILISI